MGKRSDKPPRRHDKYLTPAEAVAPLLPFVRGRFVEPCAGDGRLVRHLVRAGLECVAAFDLHPDSLFVARGDALAVTLPPVPIITNPPWTRSILHPMIERFRDRTAWLLFDADWAHTAQAAPLLPYCSCIVSVGRVKWIEGSKTAGKDNAAWYHFGPAAGAGPLFIGRKPRA